MDSSSEGSPSATNHDLCCIDSQRTAHSKNGSHSLNSDPYNLRSEELAIAECTRGVEVRREWSEQEMVCAFGGHMFPGTPDGMFEAWDGTLTCVQVVRVPLTKEMGSEDLEVVLAQTVVTKVVKSQQWLRAAHVTPFDFIIFCWLPFFISETLADRAHLLMQRIRKQDPRFSLRLRVPAAAGALFPALFACNTQSQSGSRCYSEIDVSTFSGEEEERDEDEACTWDITWAWDCEWQLQDEAVEAVEGDESDTSRSEAAQFSNPQVNIMDRAEYNQCTSPQTSKHEVRLLWDSGG